MDDDYRVELDIYNGPLDLLLYLVYKNEVDIFNIHVAGILDQYLKYVEVIKSIDLELAGDFLVMASRLINIKSKMLMPRPDKEPQEEEVIDPRAELVKELLEYKEYKERAYALGQSLQRREKMFERVPPKEELSAEKTLLEPVDEEVGMWDLLMAFHRITKDFMPEVPRKIVYDDAPVHVYLDSLVKKLSEAPEGRLEFSALFDSLEERIRVIGMFLGVLEAVKQGAVRAQQLEDRGEIYLEFVPEEERSPRTPEPQAQDSKSCPEAEAEPRKNGNGLSQENSL